MNKSPKPFPLVATFAGLVLISNPLFAELNPNTPSSALAQQASKLNSDELKMLQKELKNLEIYEGKLDGIYGPNMANAIEAYQEKEGLTVNGKASRELLNYIAKNQAQIKRTNQFLAAVKSADLKAVSKIAEEGIDTTVTDEKGSTGLHIAAAQGNEQMVALLFKIGSIADIPDEMGRTPLMNAALGDHLSIIETIIKQGADVTVTDIDGKNAAELAQAQGHQKTADYLNDLILSRETVSAETEIVEWAEKAREQLQIGEDPILVLSEAKEMQTRHGNHTKIQEITDRVLRILLNNRRVTDDASATKAIEISKNIRALNLAPAKMLILEGDAYFYFKQLSEAKQSYNQWLDQADPADHQYQSVQHKLSLIALQQTPAQSQPVTQEAEEKPADDGKLFGFDLERIKIPEVRQGLQWLKNQFNQKSEWEDE